MRVAKLARGLPRTALLPAAALLFLLAAGCHRRPRKEIRQAKTDLQVALGAQAQTYAPASFQEARRALADAERMVTKRKFEDARLLALESSARSKSAVSLSAENRQKMLAALRLQLDTTAGKIGQGEMETEEAARRAIDAKRVELFRVDSKDARAKLDSARRLLAQGNLAASKKQGDDADIAAESLLREVRLTMAEEPIQHPRARRAPAPKSD